MEYHSLQDSLLLLCCNSQLDELLAKRVREMAADKTIDWDIVLQRAARQRVSALLYNGLSKSCWDLVPDSIKQQMRTLFIQNAACNILMCETLQSILNLFEDNNIQAVSFKGPLLTIEAYGDLSLRSFGDLDILIDPEKMEQAVCLLLQHGYKIVYDLPLKTYLKLVSTHHHANLVNQSNGLHIELHWEMSARYSTRTMDLSYMRPRLETISLNDQTVFNLGQEDLLVYLCVHGNRHRWVQLDAVCCIAELIKKRPAIDWDLTLKIARDFDVVRILLLGLMLAQELLNVTLPDIVKQAFNNAPVLNKLSTQISSQMLRQETESQGIEHHLSGLLHHYHTLDYRTAALSYGMRKFCCPDIYDLKWLHLPSQLWFLYPVLRLLRFASKYGQQLFKKDIANE